MKICIIDSGIDKTFQNEYPDIVFYDYCFYNEKIIKDDNPTDYIGHGTAINNIICKYIKEKSIKAEIYNIKVFDSQLNVDINKLSVALEFCISKQIDILNLSLGCYSYNKRLEHLCNELADAGCIICAANDMLAYNVYPANFKNSISVCATNNFNVLQLNEHVYIEDENKKYNILTYGGRARVKWIKNTEIIAEGVSFACPRIVIKIITAYAQGIKSFVDILNYLKQTAKSTINYSCNYSKLICDGKIALFPFNKEMHSIARFNKDYNITTVMDFRGRGIIGRYIGDLINEKNQLSMLKVADVEDETNYENFDAIIIGDCSRLNELYGDRLYKCMQKWKTLGKRMYTFMPCEGLYECCEPLIPKYDLDYFNLLENRVFLEEIECLKPILGIYGTSTQQGKFTLQNKLAFNLGKMGYDCSLFCTENQAVLLDCDMVFPYGGFNDKMVVLPPYLLNKTYLHLLKQLSLLKSDLIIISGQSGLIDTSIHTNMSVLQNINLLFLANIDVSVLVVNSTDKISTVKRAFDMLQAFTKRAIACIVIFPYSQKENRTEKELQDLCAYYKKMFNTNCHIISDLNKICLDIITAFTNKEEKISD